MNRLSARKSKEMDDYILNDYHFLQDYEVINANKLNQNSFVACIKDTEQKVRFIKKKYKEEQFCRFKALHKLYKNGIVLADNMFVLEEDEEMYYYIIEAEIDKEQSRFRNLQHYLVEEEISQETIKNMLGKIKILIDCVHQEGQPYAGIDPRKLIIDEENHLFLAPYDLDFQLKTDNFSRSYYSPQILLKMSNSESQIREDMMLKWDVWSFGCICAQLLTFSSPIFMSTSLPSQLKLIKTTKIQDQFTINEQSIYNMLINSLKIDPKIRTISTVLTQTTEDEPKTVQNIYKETISHISSLKKEQFTNGMVLRELNIHQRNDGDCKFTMNLFHLSNIKFQKELHVSVFLGKIYHFYVDFDQKSPKKYPLNRKITIKANFDQFQKLISQPVTLQLKENQKKTKILLNLQALIIFQDGKRIWNEPLIGNYSSSSDSDFPRVRLKVTSSLITPEIVNIRKQVKSNKNKKEKENQLTVQKICQKQKSKDEKQQKRVEKSIVQPEPKSILRQRSDSELNKPKKKVRQYKCQKYPSISQISQSMSLLTEQLKRKIVDEDEPPQDEIKKQLSSLLQIE